MRTIFTLLTLLAALLITHGASAQMRLSGRVTDSDGRPVAQAAIILQTADSSYVTSAITDSIGAFHIDATPNDRATYRLIVQHVAYETHEQTVHRDQANEIAVRLTERAQAMPEIVVRGERPIARLSGGRIIYDLPRLIAGRVAANAYEALLLLPGVRDEGDALTLAGAPSLAILIDGRKTSLSGEALRTVLRSIPARDIRSAEVMYSAPPQYHVRGAAILLVTRDAAGKDGGWQGQINADYAQRHYANYTLGAALVRTAPRWMLRLNASSEASHTRGGLDIDADHFYHNRHQAVTQQDRTTHRAQTHLIRMETDLQLSKQSHLGLVYTARLVTGRRSERIGEGTLGLSHSRTSNERPTQLHNALLDLSTGFGLKLGAEYTRYEERLQQHFAYENTLSHTSTDLTTRNAQQIDRLRVFADQSHPIGKALKVNYGAEYLYATDHSAQRYASDDVAGLPDIDNRLTERTARLYLGTEFALTSNFSLSASLTGEDYRFANTHDRTLFPEFSVTWALSPGQILQASLTSDKVYPAYWESHGGKTFLNAYAEVHGNPLLHPYRSYASRLSYIINGKFIFTLYATRMPGYSVQLPYQSPSSPALIYQSTNFDYKRTLGDKHDVPIHPLPNVQSRLGLNASTDHVRHSHFHDLTFDRHRMLLYARLDNTFHLGHHLTLELNASTITPSMQGIADINGLWRIDTGLKWTVARGAADLQLKADDVFATWSPRLHTDYAKQQLRMYVVPDTRAVTLTFIYRLRGYKPSKAPHLDTSRFGTSE